MKRKPRSSRLRIVFLGTGNAFNTGGRGSQSIWIEPRGRAPFLADVGPTALAAMERSRLDPGRIGAVFITHLHGDHTAGWPFLLLHSTYVARRSRPLRIFGPRGTRDRLETLATSCYEDLTRGKALRFPLEHIEIPVARGTVRGAGMSVDVIPVEHHPTSIAYRFRVAGLTVAVSGDTRWCPAVEELSRGCDLLILECTCLRKPEYAHVSLEELRDGIGRLGARRTILVHLDDAVARALRRRPIPGVTAAEDGMTLAL